MINDMMEKTADTTKPIWWNVISAKRGSSLTTWPNTSQKMCCRMLAVVFNVLVESASVVLQTTITNGCNCNSCFLLLTCSQVQVKAKLFVLLSSVLQRHAIPDRRAVQL